MGRRGRRATVHGVLVVDKPQGPTSHDVVARVRRALDTRAVGHAGTLDPMATGVLVLAVGEATKLVRWLTADDKTYRATVTLGAETDTLDAEGEIVARAPVPPLDRAAVEVAALRFVGTYRQAPPAFSAIKVDGEALYARARRGEHVEVAEREVTVHRLDVLAVEGDRVELEVDAAKGFYVRSLARDLAGALGTRGHLTALRRTRSGPFALADALDSAQLEAAASGDDAARARLRAALLSPADACRGMPRTRLNARGVEDARHGRPIRVADATDAEALAIDAEPVALLDHAGALVAVAARRGEALQVIRGLGATGP